MNKFVFGALAAPLLSATGLATDTEWPELDRELAALSNAPLTQESGGPYFSGWLIGAFDYNADYEATGVTGNPKEEVGFDMRAARIQVSGSVEGGYGYVFGYDFFDAGEVYVEAAQASGDGLAGITDAYAWFGIEDVLNLKLGVFRPPALRSALVQRNQTLFIDRSFLGGQESNRELGLGLDGNFSRVNWSLAAYNGWDGMRDGMGYGARVDIDILGKISDTEGAYGANPGTNLNLGIVYSDDTSDWTADDFATYPDPPFSDMNNPAISEGGSRDATTIGADLTLTTGGFSAFAEIVDYERHVGPRWGYYQDDASNPTGLIDSGSTPWSVGLSYLFAEVYEVGFRYDNWDDRNPDHIQQQNYDTTRYNFVMNRYVHGHDVKWQLQYSWGDSDVGAYNPGMTASEKANEYSVLSIGLAVGF